MTPRRRLGTGVAAAWIVGIAVVYFEPAFGAGMRKVAHSTLPPRPHRVVATDLLHLCEAGLVFLAAWAVGRAVLALVRRADGGAREDRVESVGRFVTETALGLGALSVIALSLSPLGLLRRGALVGIVAAGGLAGAVLIWRARPRIPRPPRGHLDRALLLLIAAAGLFALIGALAPEVEYDALWYHLALPQHALRAGRLVDLPCVFPSFYPLGTELVFGYGLALGGAVTAKLVHFGFGVLLVLATYDLGARLATRRVGLIAAAVLALTPTVLWEATTAYVDLATSLYVILALDWTLRHVRAPSRSSLLLAGVFGALALGTKHLAVFALLPLGAIILLAPRKLSPRARAGGAAALTAIVLLPNLPWYLRAQIETGNPVFPSFFKLFGADPGRWNAVANDGLQHFYDKFGIHHGIAGIFTAPWDATMHAADFGGCLGVGCLMLVPLAVHRRLSRPLVLLALFCLAFLVLWASPPSSPQMRYLLPALGPLAILAGVGLERVRAAGGWPAGASAAFVLVVLAAGLPPFLRMNERSGAGTLTSVELETPAAVVLGSEARSAYLARRLPAYAALTRLNALVRRGDVAYTVTDPFLHYYARPELITNDAVCNPAGQATVGHEQEAYAGLRAADVRYVLIQRAFARRAAYLAVVGPAFQRRYLRPVYRDGTATLYRVVSAR